MNARLRKQPIRRAVFAAAALLVVSVGGAPPAAAEIDKSDNVTLVKHYPFPGSPDAPVGGQGATDIDFMGKYVYAAQQGEGGGVHIFDVSKDIPKEVGFAPCPGTQNDVVAIKPGLIALGYHSSSCGEPGSGIRLLDVRNPKRPKLLGAINDIPGGTHTLTAYPGKPLVYLSTNGGAGGGGRGAEHIVDVSNPKKPEIVNSFVSNGLGCHDLYFYIGEDRQLAFCASAISAHSMIWDVSDPVAPEILSVIPNPLFQIHHTAVPSPDGQLLVISDETEAQDCVGGPTGAMWVYDISTPEAPVLQSWFKIPRGQAPVGTGRPTWCSAHNFNWIPGTHIMVSSWYAGGMSVWDLSNPTMPEEIAYYFGSGEEVANYWSAYWYDGKIYANDRVRGLDVFEVKGLEEGSG